MTQLFFFQTGGGLKTYQMMPGLVQDFQIWNRAFTETEVTGLACGERGNLLTFDDFEVVGDQQKVERSAFACKGKFCCTFATSYGDVLY